MPHPCHMSSEHWSRWCWWHSDRLDVTWLLLLSTKDKLCWICFHTFSIKGGILSLPWERKWQPSLVFLPRTFPGQRSLGDYQSMGTQRVSRNWACAPSIVVVLQHCIKSCFPLGNICLYQNHKILSNKWCMMNFKTYICLFYFLRCQSRFHDGMCRT